MANIMNEKEKLVYRYDSELLTVEPWGENSLRVRSVKQAPMPEEDWALLKPAKTHPEIYVSEGGGTIRNGKIKASLSPRGKTNFL